MIAHACNGRQSNHEFLHDVYFTKTQAPIQPTDRFCVVDIWYYIKLPPIIFFCNLSKECFFQSLSWFKIRVANKKREPQLFTYVYHANQSSILVRGWSKNVWAIRAKIFLLLQLFFPSPQEKQSQFQLLGALGFGAILDAWAIKLVAIEEYIEFCWLKVCQGDNESIEKYRCPHWIVRIIR